jgi:glutamate carboxypeptidase
MQYHRLAVPPHPSRPARAGSCTQRAAPAALPANLGVPLAGALVAALLAGMLPTAALAAAAPPATAVAAASSPQSVRAESAPRHLSRAEDAVVRAVDRRNDDALALLERVVNVNSGTQNHDGVRAVGAIFRQQLEALGFTVRWADGDAFARAGHLVAERAGRPGSERQPHVLLVGHLDTVFDRESPFQRLERLPDATHARGPGVIDMKGGDVILVHALAALRTTGDLDRLHVTVYLGGDEEDSGKPLSLARRDLVAAAQGVDVALGFEDGDGIADHAVVVRRGAAGWTLRTTGNAAHSSQIFQPEVGAGAVYEAARILAGVYTALAGQPNLTFNPGLVAGGTTTDVAADETHATVAGKDNVVAATAVVHGDLRTISPEQLADVQRKMQEVVAGHLPGTSATLMFDDGYPPMAAKPGNLALLAVYDQASRDLGLGPVTAVDPRNAGAADVSFVAASVPRVLDALGLKGNGGHTAQETADLTALRPQTEKAALLLYRLSRGLPAVPGAR